MSDGLIDLAEAIQELNSRWKPHEAQIPIGRALFYQGAKDIFVCAGRNFGKTELAGYCSWRYAAEHPGSENYIFEPYSKQAREILWASQRIQNFGPEQWVEGLNTTEMRITFKNGSFIKLEGSDNSAAMAGIKPKGLIIYDEFKDHRFTSIDNFEPNRAAFDVPALFIGTPPMVHNHYVDYMDLAKSDSNWRFFHAPTSSNPFIKKSWLERKKAEKIKMGDLEGWLREYEALFVKGGKGSIFPQFFKMSRPNFDEVRPKDLNKWQILVSFDPASTSVFGVVFLLFNEWTKQTIVFDELYVDDQALMTAREIHRQVEEKLQSYLKKVKDIRFGYDEAAAWFRNEINEFSNWWLEPSSKSDFGVDGYINLVRQHMNKGLLTVCANCPKLIWELESYQKDENGRIPKENDHNINALQYGLSCLGLRLDEDKPPIETDPDMQKRFHRWEEELEFSSTPAEID
ncbi:MAG TPA: hypothetical protein VIG33_14765 [Pseudobdellovibrionaceae bacterium]|jgi:hypothetical protein